jgi:hypothetical protein
MNPYSDDSDSDITDTGPESPEVRRDLFPVWNSLDEVATVEIVAVISNIDRCLAAAGGSLCIRNFNVDHHSFQLFSANILLLRLELMSLIYALHPRFGFEESVQQLDHVTLDDILNETHVGSCYGVLVFSFFQSLASIINAFFEATLDQPAKLFRELKRLYCELFYVAEVLHPLNIIVDESVRMVSYSIVWFTQLPEYTAEVFGPRYNMDNYPHDI